MLTAPLIPLLCAVFSFFLPNHEAGGGQSSLSSQSEQGKEEAGRQSMFESQYGHHLAECSCVNYSASWSGSSTPKRRSNTHDAVKALPRSPANPSRIFEHTGSCARSLPMADTPGSGCRNPAWQSPGNLPPYQALRVSHIQISAVLFPDGTAPCASSSVSRILL